MKQSPPLRIFLFTFLLFGLTALAGTRALAAQPGEPGSPIAPTIAGDLNDVSIPPLVGGVPAGPKPPSGTPAAPANPGAFFQSAADAPIINVWYSNNQTFGQNGDPQKWINIVGNVNSPVAITNLSYTLNDSPPRTISVGGNNSRLSRKGDFNIDIDYTDLDNGVNTIVITATDANAGVTTANVTVNYQPSAGSWPSGSYTIDFASATTVNQVAQVVDGNWVIDGGKARPAAGETGFDRLIALGDISWRDYTVTVPVTIHSVQMDKSPGVGLIVRWPGHYDSGNGLQPFAGWRRIGAMAWYRYDKPTGTEGLQMLGNGGGTLGTKGFNLVPGTTYVFKVNVTSNANPNKPATYRFKTWIQGQAEPANWDIEATGIAGEPRNGSILLVAHFSDVSFGNVTVDLVSTQPKPVLTINKTGTGNGNVTAIPQKATYRFGEDVNLTAIASPGSSFAGWQGDASGSAASTSVEMFADRNVTAVFADPSVQTPISDDFSGCSLDTSLWTFINPLNDVTLTMNGSQAEFSIPSGTTHDFWTSGFNAPRIMQYADNSNFELEVSFDSAMNTKNQLQGILIAGDGGKYIRYNYLHDGNGYRVQIYTFSDVQPPVTVNNQVITISAPMKLRIQRVGDYWVTRYYPNNMNTWGAVSTFEFPMTMNSFGVFAGTSGNNPSFTSKVDYFFNTASPISPEDSNRRLNITTVGTGTVARDPDKQNYACDEIVTLTATPGAGFKFGSWGGDMSGSENPKNLVMNATRNVVANFVPDVNYTVTTSVVGAGQVTKSPDKPTYSPGEQVVFTATPDPGYLFTGWSGDASGTANPLTMTVNGNLTITGNFAAAPPRTLTLTINGNGTVAKSPDKDAYINGEQVTLTATPGTNANFINWSVGIPPNTTNVTTNPFVITMDGDKTVAANFADNIYTLTLLASPTGTGSITPSPAKSAYYNGETVSLTPTPAEGYVFSKWSGDLSGNAVPGQLVMTKNSTVTAEFVTAGSFNVQMSVVGLGSVMLDPPGNPPGTYPYGAQVNLTAIPAANQEFVGWSGDLNSTNAAETITVTGNMAITATFAPKGIYSLTLLPPVNGTVMVDPVRDLYTPGQQVILTAVPNPGYIFSSWGNDGAGSTANPLVLTMDGNKTISAAFQTVPFYDLVVVPNGPGTVTTEPSGSQFADGTTVILTATPDDGYVFTGWSGDVVSNMNPYSLLMNGHKNIVANFGETNSILSDDFSGCGTLSPMWTWVDPLGVATYGMTGRQLKIVVPPEFNYEIGKDVNNVARVMQEVANTDFELNVRFDSSVTEDIQRQGVLIEAGENTYVYVDLYPDDEGLHLFAGGRTEGVSRKGFNHLFDPPPPAGISLRVQRIGDTWRVMYRFNDEDAWQGFKPNSFKFPMVVERAGVYAGSQPANKQTLAPGHTALFDYFFNPAMPIALGDANAPDIIIEKVGQGTVELTPSGPFVCGQAVQVEARPSPGWRFLNFSDGLVGSTNPRTLVVSTKHKITATFVKLDRIDLFLPMVTVNP